MDINEIGFSEEWDTEYNKWKQSDEDLIGRVAMEHKNLYKVWTEAGELLCEISGKLSYTATERADYPAVGDWVVLHARIAESRGTIYAVLPRKSKFSRKTAGLTTDEQIIAANIDTVFLVQSLNEDLNLRRIERYLLLTWESGANPIIVLTKSDLCGNLPEILEKIETVALGVTVIPISVFANENLAELTPFLQKGKTIALLGSSGVGKSTLTNFLLHEERQAVQSIREADGKGKHTTTHRELFLLPQGCVLIDTPGMREIQLWDSEEGISQTFADIEELASKCRFRDCKHEEEPGCAVKEAIAKNRLSEERFLSYKKLLRELAFLERKQDRREKANEKKRWKNITKETRQKQKNKY
ncbi:ribosome small subunit-dependent GTPase A [Bacillaceae bacterium Marseille-Q3522]|nr:ribosome small subunit-dependent GTPase A [Bacillaceae bacterium Marseille-Q3522]